MPLCLRHFLFFLPGISLPLVTCLSCRPHVGHHFLQETFPPSCMLSLCSSSTSSVLSWLDQPPFTNLTCTESFSQPRDQRPFVHLHLQCQEYVGILWISTCWTETQETENTTFRRERWLRKQLWTYTNIQTLYNLLSVRSLDLYLMISDLAEYVVLC